MHRIIFHISNLHSGEVLTSCKLIIGLLVCALLCMTEYAGVVHCQSLVINEAMASNALTIADVDGDTPDWIELYNKSGAAIDMEGIGISDDLAEPFKWVFPSVEMPAQGHLLIFASDKDRSDVPGYWETIIDWGDEWKYKRGGDGPAPDWAAYDFNDADWDAGPSGLGYDDDDDATVIEPDNALFIRKTFTIDDLDDVTHAVLHVDYDDGFVAYLNNVEIARANMQFAGERPHIFEHADVSTNAKIVNGGLPEVFVIENIRSLARSGTNVLAIQVHNSFGGGNDMSVIPFFTLGYRSAPENANGTPPILQTLLPRFHTNFKLSSAGETVYISAPDGELLDSVVIGAVPRDIAWGRIPDGSNVWRLLTEPTPEAANGGATFEGVAEAPEFSISAGAHGGTITIEIEEAAQGATVYYTLDGSEPTGESLQYVQPLEITATTVVRARAFGTGMIPSAIVTNSYLIDEDIHLPVISLATNPEHFWDVDSGIYVQDNIWNDWERPVHAEIFEPDGQRGVNLDAGVKIFGGFSRNGPQKSLSIFARERYGPSRIMYPLFPNDDLDEFEAIVLRNSGNDWFETMLRDGYFNGLMRHMDIDRQAYRPATLYINGEYWGIHNIREKVNEHFLAGRHGIDPENVDLLEDRGFAVHGDSRNYNAMLTYIEENDLSQEEHYNHIESIIDINNFIDYQVGQIFIVNTDWPGRNIKFWRPRTPNGKWRWIIFDTDFGFGLNPETTNDHNTIAFALEENGPDWPNPPWSTFLLRNLIRNVDFRVEFINRFADNFNTEFQTSKLLDRLDALAAHIEPEIERHKVRWGASLEGWREDVQRMRNFAAGRVEQVKGHIRERFDLPGMADVTIDVSNDGDGRVRLNSLHLQEFPWTGEYFQSNPITLTALAEPGYRFVEWRGDIESREAVIRVNLSSDITVTAVFEEFDTPTDSVVINEINYNSAQNFDSGDWIELHNFSSSDRDISGWHIKDSDDMHCYTIPAQTIIPACSYAVAVADTTLFDAFYDPAVRMQGELGFGLSGAGELIRLYDRQSNLVDSVTYDDMEPWPVEADGNGATLVLIHPTLDNALPESWTASKGYGTPGAENDVTVSIRPENQIIRVQEIAPHPFSELTSIRFAIPDDGRQNVPVNVYVYTLLGRKVATLFQGVLPPGKHVVYWNVGTPGNRSVMPGMYLYSLISGSFSTAGKLMLVD